MWIDLGTLSILLLPHLPQSPTFSLGPPTLEPPSLSHPGATLEPLPEPECGQPRCPRCSAAAAREHPGKARPPPALVGRKRNRAAPTLLLFSAQHPPPTTVIKITSFCYNLNIPTSHKGLYYTRVTPGPVFAQKSSRQVPPPDEVTY